MANNSFENQVSILAELWMNYRDDDPFDDFVEYNDIGLPLAYLLHNDLVKSTAQAEIYIEETYNLLLEAVQVEDLPYNSLDELFDNHKSD